MSSELANLGLPGGGGAGGGAGGSGDAGPPAVTAADDPQQLLRGIADGVVRALPPAVVRDVLEVERSRSLADRLAGRPGSITTLVLRREGESMTLRVERGDRLVGEAARVAGGVIIARRTLSLGEWLTVFAGQIAAIAGDAAGDAAMAERALAALGVRPAGSDVVVDSHDVAASLQALPARLADRVPSEAVRLVEGIVALLGDALPRVEGGGETEIVVRRTATVYLPDTLRAYLALPADWAGHHVLSNGLTAAEALVKQLEALEAASRRMRDAALEQDATELLVNGRFLADRFAVSSLDLSRGAPPPAS